MFCDKRETDLEMTFVVRLFLHWFSFCLVSTFIGSDPTWNYRGCVPQCESRDSKSPVIPLTVEMMTSASLNDDSDCDGESPNNVWRDSSNRSVSAADDVLQMTVKREVLSENIHQIKTKEMQKPDSEDSADKMHLLQMASLFVEAAERKKEKEIQQDNVTPEQSTGKLFIRFSLFIKHECNWL